MSAVDNPILLFCPRRLLDLRIEVVVPTLAALLPDSALQVFGDQGPTFRAVLSHQLNDMLVLFFGPRP